MKRTVIPALLGLAAIAAILGAVGTSPSIQEDPTGFTGEIVTVGAGSTPALLSNPRSVAVKGDVVSVLVHCNRVSRCNGYATLESKRTGALLGVRDYHLPAGKNARIRIPLRSGRDKRVVLRWQQDQSGWSGGYYDLTLRR